MKHLPNGTPCTLELRHHGGKTEYVDAVITGCKGTQVKVKTFYGHTLLVDPDQVTPDPVEVKETDMFEEMIEQQEEDLRKWGKWPTFPPAQPSNIQ